MNIASDPASMQAPIVNTEGRWRSPGYRSATIRARAAYVTFGLLLLTAVVLAGLEANQAELLQHVIRGDFVSVHDAVSSGDSVRTASNWYLLLWMASAIAFLGWLSRSVENVPPLMAGTPVRSPRESVGWWFVPIACLLVPYQIVRDLFDRLATQQRSGKGGLVLAWWILFVVGGAFGLASSESLRGTNITAQQLLIADQWSTASDIVDAIGIGFALWLIHEIQARADLRAIAFGLGDAGEFTAPARVSMHQGPSAPPISPAVSPAPAPAPVVISPASLTLTERLSQLQDAHEAGLVSDDEFVGKRNQLLDRL